jgi:hypothetical protein
MAALALASPVAGAAALMRGARPPSLAGAMSWTGKSDPIARTVGLLFVGLIVLAVQVALGLVFDPRYRDFPFAPLTGAAIPFLVLVLIGPHRSGAVGVAEKAFAAVLGLSVLYIVPNEGLANWQALWFSAVLIVLAFTLLRWRDAPG